MVALLTLHRPGQPVYETNTFDDVVLKALGNQGRQMQELLQRNSEVLGNSSRFAEKDGTSMAFIDCGPEYIAIMQHVLDSEAIPCCVRKGGGLFVCPSGNLEEPAEREKMAAVIQKLDKAIMPMALQEHEEEGRRILANVQTQIDPTIRVKFGDYTMPDTAGKKSPRR